MGALPAASREAEEAPREAVSMARHRERWGQGRRRGLGMMMGVGDDDGVTTGGVEAEGGDGAASREAASMVRRRGR
jgi:hypothetical protein